MLVNKQIFIHVWTWNLIDWTLLNEGKSQVIDTFWECTFWECTFFKSWVFCVYFKIKELYFEELNFIVNKHDREIATIWTPSRIRIVL